MTTKGSKKLKSNKTEAQKIPKKTSMRKSKTSKGILGHSDKFLEREKDEYDAVKECITMRFDTGASLVYLEKSGHKMAIRKFRSFKDLIKEEKLKFFHQLALDSGLEESNANVINSFQLIEKYQWELFHLEDDHTKKSAILARITELQVYIADSVDVSKEIIREQAEIKEMMKPEKELITN